MEYTHIIQTIDKLNRLCGLGELSEDDQFFISILELKLAESLLYDIGEENCKKIAKIILAVVD